MPVVRLALLYWEGAELRGRKEKAFRAGRDYFLLGASGNRLVEGGGLCLGVKR